MYMACRWRCCAVTARSELVEIGGHVPAIHPKWVRQIGIRSVDEGEKRLVHEQDLEVFDMRYIDEMGMRHAMELALATLDVNTHLHVSFDVDFLDPDVAPGVGTTVRGGPTYRESQLCMEMIADTGRLGSLDVMELNPALDVRNATAEVAVELIVSLFGKSTLMRKCSLRFRDRRCRHRRRVARVAPGGSLQRAADRARIAAGLPQHRAQRGNVHGKLRHTAGARVDAGEPRVLPPLRLSALPMRRCSRHAVCSTLRSRARS